MQQNKPRSRHCIVVLRQSATPREFIKLALEGNQGDYVIQTCGCHKTCVFDMMSRGMKNLIGLINNSAGITSTLEYLGINNHLEWSTEKSKTSQLASQLYEGYMHILFICGKFYERRRAIFSTFLAKILSNLTFEEL